MDDSYLIAITALLPLTALMLVLQDNPYQALVMRGILGAIAALVYALFGAADVALTEALVGTMLSITLYAVAVRSSMEMRLGWVQSVELESQKPSLEATSASISASASASSSTSALTTALAAGVSAEAQSSTEAKPSVLDPVLVNALREALKPDHLRLEILDYPNLEALEIALKNKHIHSAVWPKAAQSNPEAPQPAKPSGEAEPYRLQTRVKRLEEILANRLPPSLVAIDYRDVA